MKIAMVSHYFEAHRGGVEIVAGQLARAFTRLGHSVCWAAADSDPAPDDPAVCAVAIPLTVANHLERATGIPYPVPMPGAWTKLGRLVADADIVLLHDGFYLTCLMARLQARRANVPVVLIQHIGFVPYSSSLLRFAMQTLNATLTRPALRAADQVVFISALTQSYFATLRFKRLPLLVFNGVDRGTFTLADPGTDRSALRSSLGLSPDRPTILFVGRFVEKKGLGYIRRMAMLRPDWQLALAGWGPIDPASWGCDNVTVFSGRSGASLAVLYQSADALVLPSIGEGFPLVVQEALACGLPIVCGEDTARADPGAAMLPPGLLVGVDVVGTDPDRTATSFVAALSSIVETAVPDDQRAALSAFALARYSWDGTAQTLLSAFDTLLRKPATAHPS